MIKGCLIVLMGLIAMSTEMNMRKNANATVLSNSSDIPSTPPVVSQPEVHKPIEEKPVLLPEPLVIDPGPNTTQLPPVEVKTPPTLPVDAKPTPPADVKPPTALNATHPEDVKPTPPVDVKPPNAPHPEDVKPIPHVDVKPPMAPNATLPADVKSTPPDDIKPPAGPNATHPADVKPTPPNATHPLADVKPTQPNTTHPADVKPTPPNATHPADVKPTPPKNTTHPAPANNTITPHPALAPVPVPNQKPTALQACKAANKKSTVHFNFYNAITHLFLNGKDITPQIPRSELNQWSKTHTLTLNLCQGDLLSIGGKNTLGKLQGMIGTINFVNSKGVEKKYNTGADWVCDGKKATVKGLNGSITGWGKLPLIDPKAAFIWNEHPIQKGIEVSCFFIIPAN